MAVSALDENGKAVDWWFAYKVPEMSGDGPAAATGYEYAYYDSNVGQVVRSPYQLSVDQGALDATLDSIFNDPSDTIGWILYNDEMPDASKKTPTQSDNGSLGHTKGVLAFDTATQTALWLLHSWPKFSMPGAKSMPTPKYGQTYLCITIDLDTASHIAKVMLDHQEPQVFISRLPDSLAASDPLRLLAGTIDFNAAGDSHVLDFQSRGGKAFKMIAKNRKWGGDFWNQLVGPALGVSMDVETWIRGAIPSGEDSDAPGNIDLLGKHEVYDVKSIDFTKLGMPWKWPETKDHAKWGIGVEADWVCVGDINRMISQEKRGGGAVAFQEQALWAALQQTISLDLNAPAKTTEPPPPLPATTTTSSAIRPSPSDPAAPATLATLAAQAKAYLVESIPKGLEDLRSTPGVQYTEDVLARLVGAARTSIDLTAMYWSLLPDPQSADEKGFTDDQFAAMGAGTGRALYDALSAAAARGVRIRILQSPGFSGQKQESDLLRDQYPGAVSIHQVQMGDWYGGGGIMHQKVWVFDQRHIYLGSANMDWKSIMQVKEMGIAVEDCPDLAADTTRYFEGWWSFSQATPSSVEAFDEATRINRQVPPWSALIPAANRQPSPLASDQYRTPYNRQSPLQVDFDGQPAGLFLTGCPHEVCGPGRSFDGDGLVYTIQDAAKSVCVSVMDFGPVSLYSRASVANPGPGALPTDTPVWWPSLFDAVLSAVLTRKVYVRLLVSKWAHTSALIEPFLRTLQLAADAGRADRYMTAGQLEIKQFIIPGWDSTTGAYRTYPGHSRVNHTKYIVTDRRINIGTSNMTWDYFASTAGSSVNTDHPGLVRSLQSVFDRDWISSYAFRLI